jgi:hypothetical protein
MNQRDLEDDPCNHGIGRLGLVVLVNLAYVYWNCLMKFQVRLLLFFLSFFLLFLFS